MVSHLLEVSYDTLTGFARPHLHTIPERQSSKMRIFSTKPLTHLAKGASVFEKIPKFLL